jgi:hypothetical protein
VIADKEYASMAPYTNFCRKDTMKEIDGKVWANWNPTFAGACLDPVPNRYVEKEAIIEIADVGKCSGNEAVIVRAVHY